MQRARDIRLIETFGHVLRQLRAERGLTQEQLAWNADIDRTFVGLLEGGRRQPSLSVIFSLARALEVRPERLIERVRQSCPEDNAPARRASS